MSLLETKVCDIQFWNSIHFQRLSIPFPLMPFELCPYNPVSSMFSTAVVIYAYDSCTSRSPWFGSVISTRDHQNWITTQTLWEYLNTAPGSLGASHHQPGGATIQLTNSKKVEKSQTQSWGKGRVRASWPRALRAFPLTPSHGTSQFPVSPNIDVTAASGLLLSSLIQNTASEQNHPFLPAPTSILSSNPLFENPPS